MNFFKGLSPSGVAFVTIIAASGTVSFSMIKALYQVATA